MLNGHLENLPLFLARPIELYFYVFVTTRNGLISVIGILDLWNADGRNKSCR